MFGALAAAALLAGVIGAAVSTSPDAQRSVDRAHYPVVEVQAVEDANGSSE